jgi:hypothetical protein
MLVIKLKWTGDKERYVKEQTQQDCPITTHSRQILLFGPGTCHHLLRQNNSCPLHPGLIATLFAPQPSLMSFPTQRRLSTRRGSVSAGDPYGTHWLLNENPNRSSSSTLTIVRVVSPPVPPQTEVFLHEPPSRRNHIRHSSGSSAGSSSSQMFHQDTPASRMSFAFSSFSGNSNPEHAGNNNSPCTESLTNSPRSRPSSPNQSRRATPHSSSQPRLSPEQLLALARQPTSVQYNSPSKNISFYSLDTLSPEPLYGQTLSASFTPLAADVYLPFIDRPAEVSILISNPPSAKLFSLLARTFPKCEGQTSPSSSPKTVDMSGFPKDPKIWTFVQLFSWMTAVSRTIAPDALWVHQVRACIHERSELIWERIKGALGVPPELDMDDDADGIQALFADSDSIAVEIGEGVSAAQILPDNDDPEAFPTAHFEAGRDGDTDPLSLLIENIMSTSKSPSMMASNSYPGNQPPLSLPSSLASPSSLSQSLLHSPLTQEAGLHNILEAQEETESELNTSGNVGPGTPITATKGALDVHRMIHGLKISTSPILSPNIRRRAYSVTSSPSRPSTMLPQISPTRSFSSSPYPRPNRSYSSGSLHSNTSVKCDLVGTRVPGNPLFPSNFARLAVGPTLKAKYVTCFLLKRVS